MANDANVNIKVKGASAATKAFVGVGAALAAAFSVKVLTDFARESVALFNVQAEAEAKLAAIIKSTGGAANKTAEELYKEAAALQDVTKFGDEVIISAQTILATFKNIKGDNFTRVTAVAADLATVLGTDLKAAAIQLGKALNDPATQLSLLSRSGITFSEAQKQTVKDMVALGDTAGAQTLILNELESQFGGAARAAADTFGGAVQQTENLMGDMGESIGAVIADGLTPLVKGFRASLSEGGHLNDSVILLTSAVDAFSKVIASNSDSIVDWTTLMFDAAVGAALFAKDVFGIKTASELAAEKMERLVRRTKEAEDALMKANEEGNERAIFMAEKKYLALDRELDKHVAKQKKKIVESAGEAQEEAGLNAAIKARAAAAKTTDVILEELLKIDEGGGDAGGITVFGSLTMQKMKEDAQLLKDIALTKLTEINEDFNYDLKPSAFDDARQVWEDFYDDIDQIQKDTIVEAMKGNFRDAEDLWKTFRGTIAEIVGGMVSDFLAGEIRKRVEMIVSGDIGVFEAIKMATAHELAAFATELAWAAAYAVMTLGVSLAVTAIIHNFDDIVKFFEDILKPAIEAVVGLVSGIGDAAEAAFKIVEKVAGAIVDLLKPITDTIETISNFKAPDLGGGGGLNIKVGNTSVGTDGVTIGGVKILARGGSFIADQPTPLIVGENNNAEMVTVTPLGGARPSSGGGNTVVFSGLTILDDISLTRVARLLNEADKRSNRYAL